MIGIQLEGYDDFLEISPGTSIQLHLENPILGDGERISPGSYSFPFDLPVGNKSPKNAMRLKNPDVIENNEAFFKSLCKLFFGGIPFREGTIKTHEVSNESARSNFLFGLSQISPDFKTADLRTVISENVVIDNSNILKRVYVKRRDVDPYDISVNGKAYTGTATAVRDAINADAATSLDTDVYVPYSVFHIVGSSPLAMMTDNYLEIKLVQYKTVSGTPTYVDATDPLLPLRVRANDSSENYYTEAFDTGAYYDAFDAFFDGYLTGDYPDDRFRIPLTLNGAKYKDEAIQIQEVVNHINVYVSSGLLRNDATIIEYDKPFQVRNNNSLQPYVMLKWVLDKVADFFGFEYEGNFYTDPKLLDKILYNSNALDDPQEFLGEKKFVFWRRSFNMGELVPKMKVSEFFGWLQGRFNITIYYNEVTKKVTLNYREGIAKSYVYEDITSISSPLDPISDNRVQGFVLVMPRDDKDLSSVEERLEVGTPEQEIVMNCGRLHEMKFFYFGSLGRELVRVQRNFGDEFDLRIFNYRGIITTTPFSHPYAHIHGLGTDTYDIEKLYNDRWKYWLHFEKNRRIVKLTASLPIRKLLRFDWEMKRRFNRSNYLIKSIDVRLRNSGVEVSEVELITMS